MARLLTQEEKNKCIEKLNPQGNNPKQCNFFRLIFEDDKNITIEVGYWITYFNCKPRYQKENIIIQK